MDLRRLRPADVLAGLFGAALVGVLWAPWYRVPYEGAHFNRSLRAPATTVFFGGFTDVNAWQTFAVDDVIFCIAGLLGVWLLVATATYSTAAVPITAAVFAILAGLLASVLAVVRLIWPPDLIFGLALPRAAGVWLGAAAAVCMTVSAALSLRDERRTQPAPVPITPAPPVTS